MSDEQLECDFHKKYMTAPNRMDYENRYGKFGYDKFLTNYFKSLMDENFPTGSASMHELTEKQMIDLVFSKMFVGLKIELIAIKNAGTIITKTKPDPVSKINSFIDILDVYEEGLTKAIKDFASMSVRFLVNEDRYDRWRIPLVDGILTQEYWQPKIRDMFERVFDVRKIELADMAMEFEDDHTPVAVLYDNNRIFSQICNEAIYEFEYPDYSHKTAHEVFVELEEKWLNDEISAIKNRSDSKLKTAPRSRR
jgi:hypothetical protein